MTLARRHMAILMTVVLASAACSSATRRATPATTTTSTRNTARASSCSAHSLRVHGGRQGESQGAHGDIVVTNIGEQPCQLTGNPDVELLSTKDNAPLAVVAVPASTAGKPVVLQPSASASLAVYWSNWCHGPPGPLRVQLTLAPGNIITGPFDGPPDYDFVPDCINPRAPSTIQVVQPYALANA